MIFLTLCKNVGNVFPFYPEWVSVIPRCIINLPVRIAFNKIRVRLLFDAWILEYSNSLLRALCLNWSGTLNFQRSSRKNNVILPRKCIKKYWSYWDYVFIFRWSKQFKTVGRGKIRMHFRPLEREFRYRNTTSKEWLSRSKVE